MAERIRALMEFAPGATAFQLDECVLVAPVTTVMPNQAAECQHDDGYPALLDDGCREFGEHCHLDLVREVADVVPKEEFVDAIGFAEPPDLVRDLLA